jgi:threonine/homoserine/homoserine lactone efflux protein
MSLETWWLFFATVFVLCATPGPNMLHVLTRSVTYGVRRAVAAMAGCLLAMIMVLIASAAGLSALLLASPLVFEVLRYAGVAYLLWLGIRAWRTDEAPLDLGQPMPLTPAISNAALFRGGLLISLSNPKLLLFAGAFLPQFIDKAAPQAPQYVVLVVTFVLCEVFWYVVYGLGGQHLGAYLSRPALRRLFDRVTGAIFVGFGVSLLRFRLN